MGANLSILMDNCPHEVEEARIFTIGQALCCEVVRQPKENFCFKDFLIFGAWYDLQLFIKNQSRPYLIRGVHLKQGKQIIRIADLIHPKNLDLNKPWVCKNEKCNKTNIGTCAVCRYCFHNRYKKMISRFAKIPIAGIPWSVANCIVAIGTGHQSHEASDHAQAVVDTVGAALDLVMIPLFVNPVGKVLAKPTLSSIATLALSIGKNEMKTGILYLTMAAGIKKALQAAIEREDL